ncbi:MAG: NUDIX domain-containing protein [Actinobacteria bacterium]|nr:NUDIX domain-containing protein [Actinomycetota bacterium]
MTGASTNELAQFPRPSIAVDVAVLTVTDQGELGVLLHRRTGDKAGTWALPGRFLRERERLADAVERTLDEKCDLPSLALDDRTPRQLHVFDDPDRDDRGWVLSVAHLLVLPIEHLEPVVATHPDLTIAPIRDDRAALPGKQRQLPYGQDEIVARAHDELRRAYRETPDPERFLDSEEFTLSELGTVHFAILGNDHWAVDTFRRKMSRQLHDTEKQSRGVTGRPAAIYRRMR